MHLYVAGIVGTVLIREVPRIENLLYKQVPLCIGI